MTIEGTIVKKFPRKKGVSKNGKSWEIQEYILKEAYSDSTLYFYVFNSGISKSDLQVGDSAIIDCSIRAEEYKGYWHNSIEAYRILKR